MNELLLKEIKEQPVVINKFLNDQADYVNEICSKLLGQYDYILIAARGTSDNAARYAKYIFGSLNKVQVALSTPSLFTIYKNPPILKRALVIGVSQSGQSPDIVSVLKSANEQNRPTISITNDESSPLAKVSDFVINLGVGDEKAVDVDLQNISAFTEDAELNLIRELISFPDEIASASFARAPNRITTYAEKVAGAFHHFYHKCRVLDENDDIRNKRLLLVKATRCVLKSALAVLGISAPERM